jgi:histidyl-tRNA synthetase
MTTIEEFIDKLGSEAAGVQDILKLLNLLEAYKIRAWFEFDPSVVRGLAYYTGIVFEGFDRKRELRAICGGGRYDKLIESFGGEAIPAVGFGFGDAVIVELLKAKSLLPDTSLGKIDVVAYAMQEELRGKMLQVVQELRSKDIKVDVILEEKRKPKVVFQRANRLGASFVLLLGEDEDKMNQATLKDLRVSSQDRVAYENIVENVLKNL